jgi:hypothetical protein
MWFLVVDICRMFTACRSSHIPSQSSYDQFSYFKSRSRRAYPTVSQARQCYIGGKTEYVTTHHASQLPRHCSIKPTGRASHLFEMTHRVAVVYDESLLVTTLLEPGLLLCYDAVRRGFNGFNAGMSFRPWAAIQGYSWELD